MKAAIYLRAINVGGRKLLMADFKAALVKAGYAEVQTIGAAGTALVEARTADAELEAAIEAAVAAETGMAVEAFARGHAQMAAIVKANPFPQMAEDKPAGLMAIFLKDREPTDGEIAALREKISQFGGPEEVARGPGCVCIAYGAGMGQSKLTPVIYERVLKVRGTARNWNTVLKMAALTEG